MKSILTIICLCNLFLGLSYGQNYTLISDSSTVDWIGYGEMGDFQQKGTIDVESSTITVDEAGKVAGTIIFNMKSIDHQDKNLSDHLKNKDFFHVKRYSIAKFEFVQDEDGKVAGSLEMKGVTGKVSFLPEIKLHENVVTATGMVEIDRTLYGIKYNSSSYFQDLGSYAIKNKFDVSFNLKYERIK